MYPCKVNFKAQVGEKEDNPDANLASIIVIIYSSKSISILYLSIYCVLTVYKLTTKYTIYIFNIPPLKLILKFCASFLPFLDFTGGSIMNFRISDI